MKKNSTALMAALTLTAIILGVILLANSAPRADANMLNSESGFSMMTAGTVGNNESLIMIDKGAQKMLVYNLVGNNLNVIGAFNFGNAMQGGAGAAGGARP